MCTSVSGAMAARSQAVSSRVLICCLALSAMWLYDASSCSSFVASRSVHVTKLTPTQTPLLAGSPAASIVSAGAHLNHSSITVAPRTISLFGPLAVVTVFLARALASGKSAARRRVVACKSTGSCSFEDVATDPSLFVMTNIKLGDKKADFMKAASQSVAKCLSKPESYVAVCVQDGQDIIWGGSDAPCALCKVFSLGSINLENNRALTQEVSALLADFDVPANRIYVNFFDLPRENVGYNNATFAG